LGESYEHSILNEEGARYLKMTVGQLIQALHKYDHNIEVTVGADDEEEIQVIYQANLYQGKGVPTKPVVWIDIKKERE
jgi:hypothetical protein